MNYNFKYLIWVATVFLAILCIYFLSSMDQNDRLSANTNTISFSGEGKITVKPDIGLVTASIVTEAKTSKEAQDSNSKKSSAVTDFLKKQGVDEKDIKTVGYNLSPQYDYSPLSSRRPGITGYQVRQSVEIKIRNLDKVSSILDGVVTAGANEVGQLTFTVDNMEKVRTEAREKAIAEAKSKAKELRKQLGIELGKIVNFSESGDRQVMPMYADMKYGVGGAAEASSPSISTGENEIVVNVSLTYQIR